jgi:hypothetical protein
MVHHFAGWTKIPAAADRSPDRIIAATFSKEE